MRRSISLAFIVSISGYIDHIHLFPRCIEAVEIYNAGRTDFENEMARLYAEKYGLAVTAGSDNHSAAAQRKLAGMEFDSPLDSVDDFIRRVRRGECKIFIIEQE